MAIAISSITLGTDTGGSATVSVTTSESPTATQVGDLVLVIYHNDFYALSNMPTPTATGAPTLTPVTNGTADAGTNEGHVKCFTYVVNTGGAQTISATETGTHDEEKAIAAYVLTGANTTTPIDVAGNNTSTTSDTTQVLSSISPSTSDAFLIGHVSSGAGAPFNGSTSSPMTERYDQGAIGGFFGTTGATQQLAASGATGTRTFTSAGAAHWAGVLIAVRTAGGAPPGPTPMHRLISSGMSWR